MENEIYFVKYGLAFAAFVSQKIKMLCLHAITFKLVQLQFNPERTNYCLAVEWWSYSIAYYLAML